MLFILCWTCSLASFRQLQTFHETPHRCPGLMPLLTYLRSPARGGYVCLDLIVRSFLWRDSAPPWFTLVKWNPPPHVASFQDSFLSLSFALVECLLYPLFLSLSLPVLSHLSLHSTAGSLEHSQCGIDTLYFPLSLYPRWESLTQQNTDWLKINELPLFHFFLSLSLSLTLSLSFSPSPYTSRGQGPKMFHWIQLNTPPETLFIHLCPVTWPPMRIPV